MNTSNCNYLGYFPYQNIGNDVEVELLNDEKRLDEAQDYLTNTSNLSFNPDNQHILFLKSKMSNDELNIISNERFTDVGFTFSDIKSKLKRIRNSFPESKIKVLLVIRDQLDVLKSMYRERPFDPRCFEIGDYCNFEEWINIDIENGYKIMESLKYDRVISISQNIFGDNNINVIDFEDIFDKKKLNNNLIKKYGIKLKKKINTEKVINKGLTNYQFWARKVKRKYFHSLKIPRGVKKTTYNMLSKIGNKNRVFVSEDLENKINRFYNK